VLLIAGEDSLSHTIAPRLEAAQANTDRVFSWPEGRDLPTIPSRLDNLRHEVVRHNIKLIVMDPVTAYLDAHINAHKDSDVRRALTPLTDMARDLGVAVIGIRHLNKDEGKSSLYRGGGSIGFVAVARVAWVIAYEDCDQDRRVLAVNKSNLAQKPESCVLTIEKRPSDRVSHVQWQELSDRRAGELLNKKEPVTKKLDQCAANLQVLLTGGWKPATDTENALIREGFTKATIRRARIQLGVETKKSDYGGGWALRLPPPAPEGVQLF
jgi:hypothetical protein